MKISKPLLIIAAVLLVLAAVTVWVLFFRGAPREAAGDAAGEQRPGRPTGA